MIRFTWPLGREPLRVLCLGAHSDDIEIGCGGTIMRVKNDYPGAKFIWIVFSGEDKRREEATESFERFVGSNSGRLIHGGFKDGYFPYVGSEIKDFFESTVRQIEPDIVFTHYRNDRHQDHRTISDLTWNTFRNHLVLEYEVIKYDGDLGSPGFFVELSKDLCEAKIGMLLEVFSTQSDRHWFDAQTFWSMLRLRGVESGAASGFAEAFYARKLLL